MAGRVSQQDLSVAIAWLESNEGDDGEAEACRRVAAFLRKEEDSRIIAAAARDSGCSRAFVRQALIRRERKSAAQK